MLSFDDIVGQDAAISQLLTAYQADRLAHGLIFAGPAGVGKASTAGALGALFLCEKPKAQRACGNCESCRGLASGMHPDFHVITKELIRYHDKTGKSKGIDLSINVIRPEVIDKAAMKSVMGRGKVFVIEQADLMSAAAQNSLLKTLEEPAGRTLIVLLTDQPGALLATVRSRCQQVRFVPLDEATLLKQLQKRKVPVDQAKAAARFAQGSIGIALRWMEDGVIDSATELMRRLDDIFAGKPAGDLPEWFKKVAESYAQKQLDRDELSSKDQATREALGLYLRLASDHIRLRLKDESSASDLERYCDAIDAIARAERYVDSNVNIPLVFQQLAGALARAEVIV